MTDHPPAVPSTFTTEQAVEALRMHADHHRHEAKLIRLGGLYASSCGLDEDDALEEEQDAAILDRCAKQVAAQARELETVKAELAGAKEALNGRRIAYVPKEPR